MHINISKIYSLVSDKFGGGGRIFHQSFEIFQPPGAYYYLSRFNFGNQGIEDNIDDSQKHVHGLI